MEKANLTRYSVANWNERPTWIYVIVCSRGKNGRKIAGESVQWSVAGRKWARAGKRRKVVNF